MRYFLFLSVFLFIFTGCMSNSSVGVNKANLSSKFSKDAVNSVAVIGFGKNVDIRYETSIIADKFTAELVDGELFNIIDRNDIDKIINEVGFQQKSSGIGILDDKTKQKLRSIGADSILTGKLIKYRQTEHGGDIVYSEAQLVAKLLKIETGEVLWSAELSKTSKKDGKKDAETAEMLLSDIIEKMCVPLKTDNKYKLLFQKAVK